MGQGNQAVRRSRCVARKMIIKVNITGYAVATAFRKKFPPPSKLFTTVKTNKAEVRLYLAAVSQQPHILKIGCSCFRAWHPRMVNEAIGNVFRLQKIQNPVIFQPSFVAQFHRKPLVFRKNPDYRRQKLFLVGLETIRKLEQQGAAFTAKLFHHFDKSPRRLNARLFRSLVRNRLREFGRKHEIFGSYSGPFLHGILTRQTIERSIDFDCLES